ncbi:MAG: HAD family hydrolase [Promethearchaeota archaeon]
MSNFDEHLGRFSYILFDLDNTLIGIPETWKYFDDLIQEVLLSEFNFLTVPNRDARNTLWRSGKEYIKILHDWGVPDADEFWWAFDRQDEVKRKKLIANQELILYSDVIPTLQKLRANPALKLGIVTNSPDFIADHELEAYNLSKFFDAVLGLGEDQTICKPEPTGILMMMETLQATPEKTVYIGDSMIDMLAAERAGIQSMLIHRKNKQRHLSDPFVKADNQNFLQITSLDEILPYIRG